MVQISYAQFAYENKNYEHLNMRKFIARVTFDLHSMTVDAVKR